MRTSLIVSLALALGVLLGYSGAKYGTSNNASKAVATTQPITVPEPLDINLLNDEDARQQRANNYASVHDLADALSLPTQFAQTGALVALAGRSDIDAITELMTATAGVSADLTRLRLLSILLSRFAELDPALALEYLQSSSLATDNLQLLNVLFSGWARTDLNAALRAVHQLSDQESIQMAGDAILQAHKEHGEELAQDILTRLPDQYSTESYRFTALSQRAGEDPLKAFEEALLIEDRWQRIFAVQTVLEKWAQSDILAAANQLNNLQDAELKNNVQDAIMRQFAKQDAAAALEWIEGNATGELGNNMLQTALGQIIQDNPEQAMAYLEKLPAERRDPNMLHNIASTWASTDPEAAVAWVSKQEPAHAAFILQFIAQDWAMQDPDAAGQYIEKLPEEARQSWIASVASGYAQRDPAAALSWLQQYNSEPGHSAALDSVLSEWAQSDPQAVLAYVERQPDARKLSNAVVTSIWRLAEQDTASALAKLEAMPEGEMRQAATMALAQAWAQSDMQALGNWAETLDEGPSRDRVLEVMISRLGDKPERAITLINSIQSEESRARSGLQLLVVSQADSEQMRALIARLDLPANMRQELVKTAREYRRADRPDQYQWTSDIPLEIYRQR